MVLSVFPVVAAIAGLSGIYALAGKSSDSLADPIRSIVKGGLIVESATLIPIAGQVVQLVLLLMALGAGFLTMIQPRPALIDRPAAQNPNPDEIYAESMSDTGN